MTEFDWEYDLKQTQPQAAVVPRPAEASTFNWEYDLQSQQLKSPASTQSAGQSSSFDWDYDLKQAGQPTQPSAAWQQMQQTAHRKAGIPMGAAQAERPMASSQPQQQPTTSEDYYSPSKEQERSFWEQMGNSWSSGKKQWQVAQAGHDVMMSSNFDGLPLALAKHHSLQADIMAEPQAKNLFEKILSDTAASASSMAEAYKKAALPALGAGAAAGLVAGPAAIPTFKYALQAGSAYQWFKQGSGDIFLSAVAEGIDPKIARQVAIPAGVLYAAAEFVFSVIPGLPAVLRANPIISSSIRRTAMSLGKEYAKGVLLESSEEFMQQLIQSYASNIAKDIQKTKGGAALKGIPLQDMLMQAASAFVQSIGPSALLIAPRTTITTKNDLKVSQHMKAAGIPENQTLVETKRGYALQDENGKVVIQGKKIDDIIKAAMAKNTGGLPIAPVQDTDKNMRVLNPVERMEMQSDLDELKTELMTRPDWTPEDKAKLDNMELSERWDREVDIVQHIAEALGVKVVMVKGMPINGAVRSSKDTIFIDENSDQPALATMGHELSHYFASGKYETTAGMQTGDTVMRSALAAGVLQAKATELGITEDQAWQEVRGDIIGQAMTTKDFWDRVRTQSPSLFQDMYSWIAKTITKLRKLFNKQYAGAGIHHDTAGLFKSVDSMNEAFRSASDSFYEWGRVVVAKRQGAPRQRGQTTALMRIAQQNKTPAQGLPFEITPERIAEPRMETERKPLMLRQRQVVPPAPGTIARDPEVRAAVEQHVNGIGDRTELVALAKELGVESIPPSNSALKERIIDRWLTLEYEQRVSAPPTAKTTPTPEAARLEGEAPAGALEPTAAVKVAEPEGIPRAEAAARVEGEAREGAEVGAGKPTIEQAQAAVDAVPTKADGSVDMEARQKMVDKFARTIQPEIATGKPVVLPIAFHGSPTVIARFEDRDAYFSDNRKLASDYTWHRGMWRSKSTTPTIIESQISLKNPLVIDALGKRSDNLPVPWQEWKPKVFGNLPDNAVNMSALVKKAKADGHDGVVIKNVVDTADTSDRTKATVYVAFDPGTQVSPSPLTLRPDGTLAGMAKPEAREGAEVGKSLREIDAEWASERYSGAVEASKNNMWRSAVLATEHGKRAGIPVDKVVQDLRDAGYDDKQIISFMKERGNYGLLEAEGAISRLGSKEWVESQRAKGQAREGDEVGAGAVEAKPTEAPKPEGVAKEAVAEKVDVVETPSEKVVSVPSEDRPSIPAKEQKTYLLAQLDEVVKDAPMAMPERKAGTKSESWHKKRVKAIERIAKEEGITPEQWIERNVREAGDAPPMITIEVPGDGTFKIVNDKVNLLAFRNEIKTKWPTETKQGRTERLKKFESEAERDAFNERISDIGGRRERAVKEVKQEIKSKSLISDSDLILSGINPPKGYVKDGNFWWWRPDDKVSQEPIAEAPSVSPSTAYAIGQRVRMKDSPRTGVIVEIPKQTAEEVENGEVPLKVQIGKEVTTLYADLDVVPVKGTTPKLSVASSPAKLNAELERLGMDATAFKTKKDKLAAIKRAKAKAAESSKPPSDTQLSRRVREMSEPIRPKELVTTIPPGITSSEFNSLVRMVASGQIRSATVKQSYGSKIHKAVIDIVKSEASEASILLGTAPIRGIRDVQKDVGAVGERVPTDRNLSERWQWHYTVHNNTQLSRRVRAYRATPEEVRTEWRKFEELDYQQYPRQRESEVAALADERFIKAGDTETTRKIISDRQQETGKPLTAAEKQKIIRDAGSEALLKEIAAGTITMDPVTSYMATEIFSSPAAMKRAVSGDPASRSLLQVAIGQNIAELRQAARVMRWARDPVDSPATRRQALIEFLLAPDDDTIGKWAGMSDTDKYAAARAESPALEERINSLKNLGVDLNALTDEELMDDRIFSSIVRELQAQRATKMDKVYEYWRNSILSGPLTFAANTIGNLTSGVWDMFVQKPMESLVGSIIRDENAPTGKSLRAGYKAILSALTQASANAVKAFATEKPIHRGMRIEKSGVAISDIKGRYIRLPQRFLLGTDEWFKTIFHAMAAAEYAERTANQRGYTGAERDAFMKYSMSNPKSAAQLYAVEEALRLTWQNKPGDLGKAVIAARNSKGVTGWVFKFLFPFVTTPANIISVGIRKSPLGLLNMAGKKFITGAYGKPGGSQMFVRDAAEQVIAGAVTWTLYSMTQGDDDEPPRLTGSASSDPEERRFQWAHMPPQSIRIGDKWYSYSRIEPFATMITPIVDGINMWRKAKRGQGDTIPQDVWNSMKQLVRDKTFLQSLSDFISAIEDEDKAIRILQNFASSWMPNIVRQSLRATDPYIRDYRSQKEGWERTKDELKKLDSMILPYASRQPLPRFDWWGKPVTKKGVQPEMEGEPNSDLLWRLTVPIKEQRASTMNNIDRLIWNWNRTRTDRKDAWWPMPPRNSVKLPREEHTRKMPEAIYEKYQRRRGELAWNRLKNRTFNYDNPTSRDIDLIKEAFGKAGDIARKEVIRDMMIGR